MIISLESLFQERDQLLNNDPNLQHVDIFIDRLHNGRQPSAQIVRSPTSGRYFIIPSDSPTKRLTSLNQLLVHVESIVTVKPKYTELYFGENRVQYKSGGSFWRSTATATTATTAAAATSTATTAVTMAPILSNAAPSAPPFTSPVVDPSTSTSPFSPESMANVVMDESSSLHMNDDDYGDDEHESDASMTDTGNQMNMQLSGDHGLMPSNTGQSLVPSFLPNAIDNPSSSSSRSSSTMDINETIVQLGNQGSLMPFNQRVTNTHHGVSDFCIPNNGLVDDGDGGLMSMMNDTGDDDGMDDQQMMGMELDDPSITPSSSSQFDYIQYNSGFMDSSTDWMSQRGGGSRGVSQSFLPRSSEGSTKDDGGSNKTIDDVESSTTTVDEMTVASASNETAVKTESTTTSSKSDEPEKEVVAATQVTSPKHETTPSYRFNITSDTASRAQREEQREREALLEKERDAAQQREKELEKQIRELKKLNEEQARSIKELERKKRELKTTMHQMSSSHKTQLVALGVIVAVLVALVAFFFSKSVSNSSK